MTTENGDVYRKIIDAHVHIGLESFQSRDGLKDIANTPAAREKFENKTEDLINTMRRNRVDKAVVFPFPAPNVDLNAANSYILDSYNQYPDKIIPFALLDENIEYWLKSGIRGFKHHSGLRPIGGDGLRRYCQIISEAGVPLISHISLKYASFFTQIESIQKAAPDIVLIVAHMGRHIPNTGKGVEENLSKIKDMGNIYFETSTVRDTAALKKTIDSLGSDRVIFGSDYPFNASLGENSQRAELDFILQTNLPSWQKDMILNKNIERCLNSR